MSRWREHRAPSLAGRVLLYTAAQSPFPTCVHGLASFTYSKTLRQHSTAVRACADRARPHFIFLSSGIRYKWFTGHVRAPLWILVDSLYIHGPIVSSAATRQNTRTNLVKYGHSKVWMSFPISATPASSQSIPCPSTSHTALSRTSTASSSRDFYEPTSQAKNTREACPVQYASSYS